MLTTAAGVDHAFVCIYDLHKELESDPYALVCDPWYKSVFFLKNLKQYYAIDGYYTTHFNFEFYDNCTSRYRHLKDIPPRSFLGRY